MAKKQSLIDVDIVATLLLRPMKDALRALATDGEVCNALREGWGAYTPQEFF